MGVTRASTKSEQFAVVVATVRTACEPQPGDADYKLRKCRKCGKDFVRPVSRRSRWCVECSTERLMEANAQVAAKTGPKYEAMVRSVGAFAAREAERLGLQPPDA